MHKYVFCFLLSFSCFLLFIIVNHAGLLKRGELNKQSNRERNFSIAFNNNKIMSLKVRILIIILLTRFIFVKTFVCGFDDVSIFKDVTVTPFGGSLRLLSLEIVFVVVVFDEVVVVVADIGELSEVFNCINNNGNKSIKYDRNSFTWHSIIGKCEKKNSIKFLLNKIN